MIIIDTGVIQQPCTSREAVEKWPQAIQPTIVPVPIVSGNHSLSCS